MVPLRFIQGWNGYDRGAEVNFPHPGLAEELVRMRVAEVIRPAVAVPTPAATVPPPDAGKPKKK